MWERYGIVYCVSWSGKEYVISFADIYGGKGLGLRMNSSKLVTSN